MLAVYRRSFKELVTYFFVFNIALIAERIIDEQIFTFWVCIIKKINAKVCHPSGIGSYIASSGESWDAVGMLTVFYNVLFLIPLFLIYFPLLDYCQRKIPNKKLPYLLCGLFIGIFIGGFMRLSSNLSAMGTVTPLLFTMSVIIIMLFKVLFELLSKILGKKVFYIIGAVLTGSTICALLFNGLMDALLMILFFLLLTVGLFKIFSNLSGKKKPI